MNRFLTGQLLILLLVILAIAMIGGRAITWLHPAPWAFLLVPVLASVAVLSVHSWGVLRQAIHDGLSPSRRPSLGTSTKVWRLAESCLYYGAASAGLMGLMVTCQVQGPDVQHLGAKLAACLAPPFYGVVLGLSCRILRARVESET